MNASFGLRREVAALAFLIALLPLLANASARAAERAASWLSPSALVAAPDGRTLYIACTTGDRVLVVDLPSRQVVRSFASLGTPTGLALSSDAATLFVTCAAPESEVCLVDVAGAQISARLPAGHTAMAPVLSPDGTTLFVCNRFNDDVSVFDVRARKELRRIPVRREPVAAALTADGRHLLVANFLPAGRADVAHVSAVLTVIDTARGEIVDDLWLPTGTASVTDVRASPDGKTAVVLHVLGRFWLPTIGVERGRMNSSAATLVDLDGLRVINTVVLDELERGAANPWAAAWSADSRTLVITHAGTHEVSVIDSVALLGKLAKLPPASARADFAPYSSPLAPPPGPPPVKYDLQFLADIRERRLLPATDFGPRAVVVVGRLAGVTNYFSDTLTLLELDGPQPKSESIPLGPPPQMTAARRGELQFHDAQLCLQGWQTCASCHPGGARADALNWDLLNDGRGTPKNTKSLLLAFRTPPAMSTGVRASAAAAVRAGIHHILFTQPPPEIADELDAYLQSLSPVPSPHRVNGRLSVPAQRGEKLFHDRKIGCARCHPPPLFTNLKSYDVGTRTRFDRPPGPFDTPTLVELWRTAPYLHDGSAPTIRDVLTTANPKDRHGRTSHLTADELLDLCAYVLSL